MLKDKEEIQNLIRQMLNWASSEEVIKILPMLADDNKVVTGFDLDWHKANLDTLRATGFFAEEFIENYNQIILTLDKMVKNNDFGTFYINEIPPFRFASDYSPWCACQDVPYDNPNPRDYVEVKIIEIQNDKANISWTWGSPDPDKYPVWENFAYHFNTTKEGGKWKISCLQHFDFKESTRLPSEN
ncbi:MAG: hypothetical protein LBS52_01265 [Dysgonamonadaceae bacterium]|jgi:hypothetical protein|nr:hypothetical protein [Dysgonamonadaceae bacterium]